MGSLEKGEQEKAFVEVKKTILASKEDDGSFGSKIVGSVVKARSVNKFAILANSYDEVQYDVSGIENEVENELERFTMVSPESLE